MLHNIIDRRQQALLNAWKASAFFQVQVENPGVLGKIVFIDTENVAGSVLPVGRRRSSSVAVVTAPGNPDSNASLWVAAGYSDYRSAYASFASIVYGGKYNKADLAGYDVDHLLNRARSPSTSTFIRVEAISSHVNQTWGLLFEKAASSPLFYANQYRERRTMSWMIASKLAGQLPPAGPDDSTGIARLVSYWVSQGFPHEQVQFAIADEINRAFGRPAGGTITPTVPWK